MGSEVGAGMGPQLRLQLVQRRRDRPVLGDGRGRHYRAEQPVPGRADAEPPVRLAYLVHDGGQFFRRRCHLHLAVDPLGGGGIARETDAERPAHQAAPAVASHHPLGPHLGAVGNPDRHAVVVLFHPRDLAAAADLRTELGGALGEEPVGDRLRDAEDVGVGGVQVLRQGLVDPRETADAGILRPVGEEPVQQPALVHDFNAARVQAERTDRLARLRVLLQHEHVYAVQAQLAGQHHARRPAAADDYVEHEKSPIQNDARRPILADGGGLAASPGAGDILKMRGRKFTLSGRADAVPEP
jgi:hypothetical protein